MSVLTSYGMFSPRKDTDCRVSKLNMCTFATLCRMRIKSKSYISCLTASKQEEVRDKIMKHVSGLEEYQKSSENESERSITM